VAAVPPMRTSPYRSQDVTKSVDTHSQARAFFYSAFLGMKEVSATARGPRDIALPKRSAPVRPQGVAEQQVPVGSLASAPAGAFVAIARM